MKIYRQLKRLTKNKKKLKQALLTAAAALGASAAMATPFMLRRTNVMPPMSVVVPKTSITPMVHNPATKTRRRSQQELLLEHASRMGRIHKSKSGSRFAPY